MSQSLTCKKKWRRGQRRMRSLRRFRRSSWRRVFGPFTRSSTRSARHLHSSPCCKQPAASGRRRGIHTGIIAKQKAAASAVLAVPNWGEQITAIKFDEVKSAMRQQAALAVAQQCSEVGTALRATRRLWTYGAVGGLAGISRFRGRAAE